jgi:hypothetical protein
MTKTAPLKSCVVLYETYMEYALADAEDGTFDHDADAQAAIAFAMSQDETLRSLIALRKRPVNFIEPDEVLPEAIAGWTKKVKQRDGSMKTIPATPEMLSATERFEILSKTAGTRAHARQVWEAAKPEPFDA